MTTAPKSVAVVDAGDADLPRLRALQRALDTRISIGPADGSELIARATGARVLATLYTYTQITDEVLAGLPELELVITRTAGYSHIDAASAERRGVAVATVPDAPTIAVAEFAFGALLAGRRRVLEAAASTRGGDWDFRGFRGSDLHGAALGVIGLGRIGRRIAQLGAAFGMDVIGWSRSGAPVAGVRHAELDELVRAADVLSLSVALTPETRGLLGAARVAAMKPTAWLVNTARGEVLDTAAVIAALRAGRLAGACLDVLESEPVDRRRLEALADVPGLILTPHVSWHTDGTLDRQFQGMTEAIVAFCAGEPIDRVHPAKEPA